MNKIILSIGLFFFGVSMLQAQRLEDMVDLPATPQTAALFKSIAAPVTYYTGQPGVSIPIYTISQDGVSIPISLSFNTSGILVTEEATPIGLGVVLDWGGSIVRTVNGSPDEKGFFTNSYMMDNLKQELTKNYTNYSSLTCYPYCGYTASLTALQQRMELYHQANLYNDPYAASPTPINTDFQPDDFQYNFFGKSGLFKYNQSTAKFVTFPLDDIKIQNLSATNTLQKFDITKSDGTKITFGDGACESTEKFPQSYVQSLFIKKVTTVKNSTIDFTYMDNQYQKISTAGTELRVPFPNGGYDSGGQTTSYIYHEKLIKSIAFKEGKIDFIYINDRVDIPLTDPNSGLPNASQPAPRLSKIIISDVNNLPIKTYQFYQSYFTASSSYGDLYNKRLKLDALSINNSSSQIVENYKFEYNTTSSIPSKKSLAKDHWGYYNGAINNTTLIPTTVTPIAMNGTTGTGWSGYDSWHNYFNQSMKGNRFVNSDVNNVFTLKKITFPTGGSREYIFENNQVRWYEQFSQMKDISNDGYDIFTQNLMVQGQNLSDCYPAPSSTTTTQKIVYGNEFTITDFMDTVLGEPSAYIRSSFVNPSITPSMLNSWEYSIQIGLEKKSGTTFSNYTTLAYRKRTDSNFNTDPYALKLPTLPNGTYRIYVKLTTPPDYVMNQWSTATPGHNTVIGLAYRKMNQGDIKVGGLRVKEIIDRDGTNEYRTTYEYTITGGYSSGRMINLPEYKENIETVTHIDGSDQFYPYHGYRICSEAVIPLVKTLGSNVGYTNVVKKTIGGSNTIKEEYSYTFTPSNYAGYLKQYYQETEPKPWQSGKLISNKKYSNNTLVSEDIFNYYGQTNEIDKGFVEEINTGLITGGAYAANFEDDRYKISIDRRSTNPFNYQGLDFYPNLYYFDNRSDVVIGTEGNFTSVVISPPLKIPYFKFYTGFDKLKSKTTTNYFGATVVTQTENYYYDAISTHLGMTRQETTNSLNETLVTKFYYPYELSSEPFMSDMITANRIGEPIKTEKFVNSVKVNEERSTYLKDATTSNLLMVKNLYSAKFPNSLPPINSYVGQLENKVTYNSYGSNGELTQYTPEGGMVTTIIWGYNKSYPIAKIENATYTQVSSYVTALQSASNNGTLTQSSFASLRSALPNAMITTYTYKMMIGVSSLSDARGNTTTYEYDTFGRLKVIKDAQGKILSENDYNYKQ